MGSGNHGPSARGWEMIIIVSVLVAISTIAAVLRLLARLRLHVKLMADDYLCFASVFWMYAMLIELVLCELPIKTFFHTER